MKLSIIVPVYNEAPYLRRCLDTIEPREGVEVILIDDGSTDGSWEIMQEYRDRFQVFSLGENCGVSYTRELGVAKSKGEYIAFIDADDALAPEGVLIMLKAIERRPDAEVIQLNHYRCKGEQIRLDPRYYVRQGFYDTANLPQKWAPVWNKLYKREFIRKNGITFPLEQQFDEDRAFNIQCLKHAGGIACVEYAALRKYFDNDKSLCHTVDREKITTALETLVGMLKKEEAPEIIELIRKSLTMHLTSEKFNRAFQEATK